MTDRELLEAAAKAAGLLVWDWLPGPHGFAIETAPGHSRRWNPLTDDGDALRLAVKLRLEVWNNGQEGCAAYDESSDMVAEWNNGDPYAATRRAIVSAAAAMVKA